MISEIKTFLRIVATVKNWPVVSVAYFFPKKEFFGAFRNGNKIRILPGKWKDFINYVNFFRIFPFGIIEGEKVKIKYGINDLIFNCGKMGPCVLNEVFGVEIYKKALDEFDIKNRVVIDIGASFGDTAVYFSLNGAKKVFAFEPFPSAYKLAEENIKLNNLQDKCQVINAAVGWGRGAYIEDLKFKYIFERDKKEYYNNKQVPIMTLQDIVDKFGVKSAVLKIDCEGREYDIILNSSNELLRKFCYIIIEYHYGFENLRDKLLDAGFSVKCGKSAELYADDRQNGLKQMQVGYLYARNII
ncbi:MAG: FkbM family methyltransferase [Patescibacteria group bacterium]